MNKYNLYNSTDNSKIQWYNNHYRKLGDPLIPLSIQPTYIPPETHKATKQLKQYLSSNPVSDKNSDFFLNAVSHNTDTSL